MDSTQLAVKPEVLLLRQVAIAQYFEDLATWYRHRANGFRSDRDCIKSATIITGFAAFVRALAEDDTRLRLLWSLAGRAGDETLSPGPSLSAAIASLQTGEVGDYEVYLTSLVHAAINDAIVNEECIIPRLVSELTQPVSETIHDSVMSGMS